MLIAVEEELNIISKYYHSLLYINPSYLARPVAHLAYQDVRTQKKMITEVEKPIFFLLLCISKLESLFGLLDKMYSFTLIYVH